jgi:hypothetical protein
MLCLASFSVRISSCREYVEQTHLVGRVAFKKG